MKPAHLFLLASLLLVAGCGDDKIVSPDEINGELFFPLHDGSRWTYLNTSGDTLFQREVLSRSTVDHQLAFQMRKTFYSDSGPSYTSDAMFAHDGNRVLARDQDEFGVLFWSHLYYMHPDSAGVPLVLTVDDEEQPSVRDVIAGGLTLTTPDTTYHGCLQIRTTDQDAYDRSGFTDEYFAPGIGLVAGYRAASVEHEPELEYYLVGYEE